MGRTLAKVVFGKQPSTRRERGRFGQTKQNHLKYIIHPSPACNRVCTVCRLCSAVSVAFGGDLAWIKPLHDFPPTCRRVVGDLTAWACICGYGRGEDGGSRKKEMGERAEPGTEMVGV